MKVTGVDFVAYSVSDLDRAVKFYEEIVGLKLDERWQDVYAEFDVNGVAFGLYAGEEPEHPSGTIAFNVASIQEAVDELKAKGAEVDDDIEETPVCRMAFVKDPDGNTFMLHEKPKV